MCIGPFECPGKGTGLILRGIAKMDRLVQLSYHSHTYRYTGLLCQGRRIHISQSRYTNETEERENTHRDGGEKEAGREA